MRGSCSTIASRTWRPLNRVTLPSPGVENVNGGYGPSMAKYELNERAVAHARDLIAKRQYVVKSSWGDVQPSADDENAFLESHPWDDYASWHLGLTVGAPDETKARYAFVCGDSGGSTGRR